MEQRSDPMIVVDAVRVLCPADPPTIPRRLALPLRLSLPYDGRDDDRPPRLKHGGGVALLRRLPDPLSPFENAGSSASPLRKFSPVWLLLLEEGATMVVVVDNVSPCVSPTEASRRERCGCFLSRRRNGWAAASSTRILRAGSCDAKKCIQKS